jgi:hypothetical protein
MLLLLVHPTAHQFQMEGVVFRPMAAEQMCKIQGLNQETQQNLVQETGVLPISPRREEGRCVRCGLAYGLGHHCP